MVILPGGKVTRPWS